MHVPAHVHDADPPGQVLSAPYASAVRVEVGEEAHVDVDVRYVKEEQPVDYDEDATAVQSE